ncbi:hypothetical protein F0P96_18260 [Hymenobacter busanensis]|uniref:Uncharacterized protein n=1 Tax=Hymenobacter busanensis TaxID=2607656 RepID=A0A7L4ZSG9_9BACT|nr:hypothetical protein [Hymenobacter busanensis]KAA9327181.1 hypothetical protein F0P96_18260 [Hymenobacter busanensis]QHJ05847.1 hypothetical protein GUY19_00460 [Hymenobacter busanensis]
MKKLVLIVFCLISWTITANAQQRESNDSQRAEQALAEQLGPERLPLDVLTALSDANRAILVQEGNQNAASIQQMRTSGASLGNLVNLVQVGSGNAATIEQAGAATRTSVEQYGTNNWVESDINGLNTESQIRQTGANNRVEQDLDVDNRRYTVEQTGRNNQLIQRENGTTTPGYEVQMRGNGIRIIIEQGRVLP